MFRALDCSSIYTSDEDNIFEDFYVPVLSAAKSYKRAVGFLSTSALFAAGAGLTSLIGRGGKISIVFGQLVSVNDYHALSAGLEIKLSEQELENSFDQFMNLGRDDLLEIRSQAFAWLFAQGQLEIKLALRPNGLFHDKIGIVEDVIGDKLVFSGSANETESALKPEFNSETISVYPAWKPEFTEHAEKLERKFERLWSDTSPGTLVVPLPEAIKEGLQVFASSFASAPSAQDERDAVARFFDKKGKAPSSDSFKPTVPKEFHGKTFALREHQRAALQAWQSNDYEGVLELATGAGKTITAIYGVTKIAEASSALCVVICAPYQDLAEQWCDELRNFNIYPIRCFRSKKQWYEQMSQRAHSWEMGDRQFTAFVVVNRTFVSDDFQNQLARFNPQNMIFIGDECHHHGSDKIASAIPNARFKLGLSATPHHYLDEKRNDNIARAYGNIVSRYTLQDAISDKVLTPYNYNVVPVELTQEEAESYIEISNKISKLMMSRGDNDHLSDNQPLRALLMKRARLIGSASRKLDALKTAIDASGGIRDLTLFYCGDGRITNETLDTADTAIDLEVDSVEDDERQIEAVSTLLDQLGWRVSRFTAAENGRQRRQILRNFSDRNINGLVAIKCLDEGIDVPACDTAFILASSRDPRQFIQRRGRILRRSPGKDRANIFDFVVTLPNGVGSLDHRSGDLLKAELKRVREFADMAINYAEVSEQLTPLLKQYGLDDLV